MTKYLTIGGMVALVILVGLCWLLYRANVKKAIIIAAQERAIVGYQQNEAKYKAFMEVDNAANKKIQKVVVGTADNTATSLNELFGGSAVPPPAHSPKPAGKAQPKVPGGR